MVDEIEERLPALAGGIDDHCGRIAATHARRSSKTFFALGMITTSQRSPYAVGTSH